MQKIYSKIESIVGNVITVRANGVKNGELGLVSYKGGQSMEIGRASCRERV